MAKIKEIWKDVPDYEGLYQVSNLGRVKSYPRKGTNGRVLIPRDDRRGYLVVNLYKIGKGKNVKVHKLVITAFCVRDTNLVTDHINCDRKDNRLINLRQITQRENAYSRLGKFSSKYVGVTFNKSSNRWVARIRIKRDHLYLGAFKKEIDASSAYQTALKSIKINYQLA